MSEVQGAAPAAESTVESSTTPEESAEMVMGTASEEEVSEEETEEVSDGEEVDNEEESEEEPEDTQEELEAAKEEIRKLKLKIHGEEQEYDLSNEEHLKKIQEMAQKGEGADQKFQEAAKMQKQMQQFDQLLRSKDGLLKIMNAYGHDFDKLTQDYVEEKLAEYEMSPEEKARRELEEKAAKYEKQLEELQQRQRQAQIEAQKANYANKINQQTIEALENSKLPRSGFVLKRIADRLESEIRKGNTNVEVKDIFPSLEKQINGEINNFVKGMSPEQIEAYFGKEIFDQVRKQRLKKARKTPKTAGQVKSTGQSEMKKSQGEKKSQPFDAKDFFSNLGDL